MPVNYPPSTPVPPTWVRKRDGRLVPFNADKISQALFAASENLGRPDAFLARELADGVVHFLAGEVEGTTPTTTQIADLTIKIVRELGQPALAQAFSSFSRQKSVSDKQPSPESELTVRFSLQDNRQPSCGLACVPIRCKQCLPATWLLPNAMAC